MADVDRLLTELRRVADGVGPALLQAGQGELLQSVADTARHLLRAAACSLALLDEDQEELVYHVASGQGAEEVVGLRLPLDRGIAGWVAVSGQPLAVSDVRQDPRFARDFGEATGYVPTSLLALPMQTERRLVGVLTVLDAAEQDGMELLSAFAQQAALAIEAGQALARVGRLLLTTAADAADGDLAAALRRAAAADSGESGEDGFTAHVLALGAASDPDRRLATALLAAVLDHSASSPR